MGKSCGAKQPGADRLSYPSRQAKRIAIYTARKLVIINPIADDSPAYSVTDAIAA